jgi:hypothetical protein
LFLVQFEDRLQPAWRAELRLHRTELLRYVPEDAFVARLDGARLSELRALPFVRWVGPYRPDHKVHRALTAPAAGAGPMDVAVLLSPAATAGETAATRQSFARLLQDSRHRFGGVLRGRLAAGQLRRLAESSTVLWIEPAPRIKLFDEVSSRIVGGDGAGRQTFTQQYGFDGSGVRVAVADSGLHVGETNGMHPDLAGRVTAFFQYGSLTDASDEHSHGTHVAGIIAGNGATGEADELGFLYGLGVAPRAKIIAQRLFDGAGSYEAPPSFETLTRDAVQAGADIGSNSWGDDTQGRYDVSAAEFDALVRDADTITPGDQPYILEFSAGNAGPGPQTIGSPAVAKNVIATGASQSSRADFFIYTDGPDAMADFSSRGPCEDGRIKPDVVAPGTWIASLRSPLGNDDNAWAPISDNYLYQGGTSQAGPQVSGAAAVFVQYYRETYASGTPSPALVKAALINSAADMLDADGTGPTPNMDEGWGRVDLTGLILSSRMHQFLDQTERLVTGQTYEQPVYIAAENEPLVITLVYTDVPGFPATIPSLVNDLDLEVIAPDGRVFRGNQFANGESVPDAPAADNINNVEGVYLDVPPRGEYLVRVRARNVVSDARADTPAVDQDFALVVSGNIPSPESAVVLLDRGAYTAPSRIRLRVIDLDRAGDASASVLVRSVTETNALPVLLLPANTNGVFTGSVATATGPALPDGALQLAHGDALTAEYFDASEGEWRIATALADLLPPVITNVTVTNQFGEMIVRWTTDEPANAVVRFGTNAALGRAVTNTAFTTAQEVTLAGLVAGQMYVFEVRSTDLAGNNATNNNGGMLYSFVAVPPATVLLVNAYTPIEGEPEIPLTGWTDALAQTGVSFDVWDTTARGMPQFANLRFYQIVMWRLNDHLFSADTIPAAQLAALTQYVNGGGAFFLASMEINSRLESYGGQAGLAFRTNVLRVQQFLRNPLLFEYCTDCDEDFRVPVAAGVTNDPLTSGASFTLDYSAYPEFPELAWGPDFGDTFTPTTNAATILTESVSGKTCGIRFPRTGQDSTGRVVFVSFPLDAIPMTAPEPNDRVSFLRNAIQFLAPGLSSFGRIALSQGAYRLPDLVTVEVLDSDLAGQPGAMVEIHSDSAPAPVPVPLLETVQPGVFRGFIPLVSGTNAPAPGQLRALHGDVIHAAYVDGPGSVTLEARALVDALPPAIFLVESEPDYQNALISWNTSEPADALVQFGESAFLNRTAYEPGLGTNHQLRLTGLVPDRTYYFQVVSRDAAGNVVVDDNQTNLYSFHTLVPLPAPFADNLEGGGGGWSVFNGEETQLEWRLGPPNNGVSASAHSPLNAWGSSLYGDNADSIDTFLISPAIDLRGGNEAQLRFWHNYDFSERTPFDLLEYGQLLLFTNTLTPPIVLSEYLDASTGWEEQVFDLTPHLGRVVFLVWYHSLLAFESASRPGWLVDDVLVTVTNVPPGTLQISNNLSHARFNLTGRFNHSGQGRVTVFTNAPPGTYAVTFLPVPWHQPPAPQTNQLDAGATVTFTGLYTFADANTNAISDAWETFYFGALTNRPPSTDSDHDGFSDYAEFVAGTNPTLPNSRLMLGAPALLPGDLVQLAWPSVPGRSYRIEGTANLRDWEPLSPWMPATLNTTSHTLPRPASTYFYRIEISP